MIAPIATWLESCSPPTPAPVVEPTAFAELLEHYRIRSGLSMNELARAVGVDPSHISRLIRGEREPPRRPVVRALVAALGLDATEGERLLLSAGYVSDRWPQILERLAQLERERAAILALLQGEG